MAFRQGDYKNTGKGMESLRAKRADVTVELRKARRETQLSKRRNLSSLQDEEMDEQLQKENATFKLVNWDTEQLEQLTQKLAGDDTHAQWEACLTVRKLLSQQLHPPIDLVLNGGFVPRLVEFLNESFCPQLQFEAAWALTNIASGNSIQTKQVIEAGAIPYLVALLKSPMPHIVEQSVWALGNLAGDGPRGRDTILQANGMPALVSLVNHEMPLQFQRTVMWAISNMCRNKNPPPVFDMIRVCLPALHTMLFSEDNDVLVDALWALSYMTDGANEKIQVVVDEGVVHRLVELLGSTHIHVLTPALRTVGNIVTGNVTQTDAVLQEGALAILSKLMMHAQPNVVKEATWTVSNILAGSTSQIQAVISAGVLEPLHRVLSQADFKSMKEAAWAVTNFTSGGNETQVAALIHLNFVPPMCYLVDCLEWKMALVLLEGLWNILKCAEKIGAVEKVATQIEESGGLDKIEALQLHSNPEIYRKAIDIIERFFSDDSQMFHISNDTNAFLALRDCSTQIMEKFDF